ncbi:threonylcarbamoyl-AMP synthase [Prorops nasuta]|uniref:threonylcarbamoyl-AMP synthase n=1 Tax=Prorops nasuta TaxID=863751 RepID=UPI0034CEDA56
MLKVAKRELEYVEEEDSKIWGVGAGLRTVALAAELLLQDKVIAVPTDTIYGLAGSARSQIAIDKIYEIKIRDKSKPLAICVSSVEEIGKWGEIDHLHPKLLNDLLPGCYTIILRRKSQLNPALNPGIDNIGIRVPNSSFIRNVTEMAGPIALTSANESNQKSTLHPDEFRDLWPKLDAIFQSQPNQTMFENGSRRGSTIIDLTEKDAFKIVRHGQGFKYATTLLYEYGYKRIHNKKIEEIARL